MDEKLYKSAIRKAFLIGFAAGFIIGIWGGIKLALVLVGTDA